MSAPHGGQPRELIDERGLIDYLATNTSSHLAASTLSSNWSELHAALWDQGDDAFETPAADTHCLAVCTGGAAIAVIRSDALVGSPYTVLHQGALFFTPAGNVCETRTEGRYETCHLMVKRRVIESLMAERIKGDPAKISLQGFNGQHDDRLLQTASALLAEMNQPAHGDALKADQLAFDLASRLIEYASTDVVPYGSESSLTPLQLKNAIDYMESCLSLDFGIKDIARYCGVDAHRFAQAFKNETGETLSNFRTERRLDYVREWLTGVGKSMSASEIARRIGFVSVENMDAAFRTHLGISFKNYADGKFG